MADDNVLTSQLYIKLNGEDVPRPTLVKVVDAVVDQHAHLPAMFTIRLHDQDMSLLDEGTFDLTKEIEIAVEKPGGPPVTLIKGEITALEPEFEPGMILVLAVRGYDKSHRLYRDVRSRSFLNKKDSDIAADIARAAGLDADIETTATVYDHIYQHNQSDMDFLRQRAWRIGFECYVAEGKLTFRRPSERVAPVTLAWGQDLLSFAPRMTLAEQVDAVIVRGWDVEKQQAIVGQAKNGRLYPTIGESKNGAEWAGDFGRGQLVIVDQPVVSQAEANALAAARLDEISGAFVQAEGLAFRRPDIRAGGLVKLENLGRRFSGDYLVTSATHSFTPDGFHTTFAVRGTRTGLLVDEMTHHTPLRRWPGVVTAVVTNSDDPRGWGRVKVKFPWLSDETESDWARVVSVGAGPEAGLFALPAVDDEVLVVFEHGDFSRPFVLGGLWNGKHSGPAETGRAGAGQKPLVRSWRSRTGHRLTVYDTGDNKMEIVTASGDLTITLDDSGKKISIESSGDIDIKAGGNLDLEARGQVNVKGSAVNLN